MHGAGRGRAYNVSIGGARREIQHRGMRARSSCDASCQCRRQPAISQQIIISLSQRVSLNRGPLVQAGWLAC